MTVRVLPVVLLALALAHTASVVVPRPVPRDVPAGARRVLPVQVAPVTPAVPVRHVVVTKIADFPPYEGLGDHWVMKVDGKYLDYHCRNSNFADRVWRMESTDGVTWTNDTMMIDGDHSAGSQDDLSCSPGVVIAPNGVWHLYYVVGHRGTPAEMCGPGTIQLWHATSFDGVGWTKLGRVEAVQSSDCSLLTPSPVIVDDKIVVFFVVDWFPPTHLWRIESDVLDGHVFADPIFTGRVPESHIGRVSRDAAGFHFVYANVMSGADIYPDTVSMTSGGTFDFLPGGRVVSATPGTFYSVNIEPGNYFEGRILVTGGNLPRCNHIAVASDLGVCNDGPTAWGVADFR
jgi:hypothetical protein